MNHLLKLGLFFVFLLVLPTILPVNAQIDDDDDIDEPIIKHNLKENKIASKTDDQVLERAEKFNFQAEVGRLMQIIVHSLYSNKEIFLRELISNASDALDKIRFLSLTDASQLGDNASLEIRIKADKETRSLYIQDNGIGMTKADLVKNLGTIAQSGTKAFLEKFQQTGGDSNLIGQFGVGFYSVFLVADKVTVYSKNNEDPVQHIWQSNSPDTFEVAEDPAGNTLGRGTRIVLRIKEDIDTDFLDENVLKGLIKKYSEFITFPIYLHTTRVEKREVEEEATEEEEEKKDEELQVEENEDEEAEEKEPKYVEEVVEEWQLMNENKPIWARNPKDVTDEEYNAFFKVLSKQPAAADPLAHIHFKGEGDVNFNSIIYIPSEVTTALDLVQQYKGWKLYVKRVFVTDNFENFMPKFLNFLVGVTDSDDLPLNVSREVLQENKLIEIIKKRLVRKAIALFQQIAQDEPIKYKQFYEMYSQNIKYGIIEDSGNRARLTKLLRFWSSKTDNQTSLESYVSRMKPNQNDIYFIGGETKEAVAKSPLLERLVKKGYEVLYMVDPIDEYMMAHIGKFDGKHKFVDVAKEGLKLDDDMDEEEKEKVKKEFEPLKNWLQKHMKDRLERVIISDRLTKSPSAIVSTSYGHTANMERVLKAQAVQDKRFAAFHGGKKVMEINPRHPIITTLAEKIKADEQDATALNTAELLYDTALLNSGYTLDHPDKFAERIHRMIKLGLNLDPSVEAPEEPETEEQPTEAPADTQQEQTHDEL